MIMSLYFCVKDKYLLNQMPPIFISHVGYLAK